ncbi:sulfotransferase family protein [Gracilimonas sp.]|uniref:sulfotransferase family protein n=1 Tax=Gracilimonas sp. TaxID=1974203 RepID=UPI00287287F8|nr:sulfotransferase [Gracilimonas sp.]
MSISVTQQDINETESNLFFITGVSRSGSTLLQSMLNMHSELVIPPETHFFHYYDRLKAGFSEADNKRIYSTKLLNHWYSNKTRIRDLELDYDEIGALSDKFKAFDPLTLYSLHLTAYRKKRVKPIIGEKTPRHILHIPKILEAYPDAKFITLFRDPRAAANSEIKAQFGSPSVIVTTKRWKKYVEMHQWLAKELSSGQYMMLRYNDFINAVEETLKKTCEFLGVNFEGEMLNYYQREETGFAEGEESWKKGTLKPIQTDKNEEWKLQLTSWQKALIDNKAGSSLTLMGYKKTEQQLSFAHKLYYQSVDLSRSFWADVTNARDEGYTDLVPKN